LPIIGWTAKSSAAAANTLAVKRAGAVPVVRLALATDIGVGTLRHRVRAPVWLVLKSSPLPLASGRLGPVRRRAPSTRLGGTGNFWGRCGNRQVRRRFGRSAGHVRPNGLHVSFGRRWRPPPRTSGPRSPWCRTPPATGSPTGGAQLRQAPVTTWKWLADIPQTVPVTDCSTWFVD
jgi:hypothetical protein